MNICFLCKNYLMNGSGGIVTYTRTMATYLAKIGHNVHIICAGKEDTSYFDGINYIHVVKVKNKKKSRGLWRFNNKFPFPEIYYSKRIASRLQDIRKIYQIDIVESPDWNFEGLWISLKKYIPIVVHLHGPMLMMIKFINYSKFLRNRFYSIFERLLISRANAIIAVSNSLARLVSESYSVNKNIINVIHNPIDLEIFCPKSEREPKEHIILYIGRLEERKGIIVLAKAIPLILHKFTDAKFFLIGNDSIKEGGESFRKYIKEISNNSDNIKFLDWMPRKDLIAFYQKSTVCIFPSLYEPFGYVCLEAMACGKAVVATNIGGFPEIIKNGINGILIPPKDEISLSNAVVNLLNNADFRNKIGCAARKTIENTFHIERLAKMNLDIYKKAIVDNIN